MNRQDNREIYLSDYKSTGQYVRKHLDQGHTVVMDGNKYKLVTYKKYNVITFGRELTEDEMKNFTLVKKIILTEDSAGKKYTYDEKYVNQYEVE